MAHHAYDRGGDGGDGTLSVSLDRYYGEDTVCVDLTGAAFANLSADQARAVGRDLLTHAEYLDGTGREVRFTSYLCQGPGGELLGEFTCRAGHTLGVPDSGFPYWTQEHKDCAPTKEVTDA
jgi:hypothetical protein